MAVRNLPVPQDLYVALVYPEVEVPTKDARKLIKDKVSLKKAIQQTSHVATLISSLYESDYEGIGNAMKDELIENSRSLLIPFFDQMKEIALRNGALSFGISGSGPSVMALTNQKEVAETIVEDIQQLLDKENINCFTYLSKINEQGPHLIK